MDDFSSLFDFLPIGAYRATPDRRIVRANPALVRLNGCASEAELLSLANDSGEAWYVQPGRRAEFGALLARDGRVDGFVSEVISHKTGERRWVSECAHEVRGAGGALRFYEGTIEDITERRQTEALRQARDRAEAANRAQTEFLSRVSHELRTPLNAILGFSQLLEMDSTLAPRHLAWTHAILRSGNHLLALVDDVLDLSSVQTGQLRVDARPVDLTALVDECWAMLAGRAAQAGLVFDDRVDRGQPWVVRADPTRLRQVLANLLSNAVKYNRLHGTLRLETERRGPDTIALRVIDSGRGLDAAQRARLFTPFDRLGVQRSGIEGTGLGLVLSQQLAQAMGGTIEVDSEPGRGSCFTLVLPAAD